MMIGGKFTNGGQIPAHGNEKDANQLIDELSQENRNLRRYLNNITGNTESYNLNSILTRLIRATEILLHKKDYDGPDYEEMEHSVKRAKKIQETLNHHPLPTKRGE